MEQQIRDTKIEVRLTKQEKEQIKGYFKENCINMSEYLRKHLLELTKYYISHKTRVFALVFLCLFRKKIIYRYI